MQPLPEMPVRVRVILFALAAAAGTIAAVPASNVDTSPPPKGECVDLERDLVEDPLPVGVLVPCPGIRPGALLTAPAGCTMNFVFRGRSWDPVLERSVDEGLFIGTAGHCVFESESAEVVWDEGTGPVAEDSAGERFGEVAYAVDTGELDFALIRIDDDREDEVNPALCHFGGPTGTATEAMPFGDLAHHFGQGIGYGQTVPGRSASATFASAAQQSFNGLAIFGDSGSPVIDTEGNAVGVAVTISVPPYMVNATRISHHLPLAEAATGVGFELQTAALAD